MNKVTGTLKAWLPEHSTLSPDDLHTVSAIDAMAFSLCDMRSTGWTYVGDATITVDLILTPDQLITSKIETLKAQQTKIRAETQERLNHLEGMIQNLLAISYVAEVSDAVL